MAAPIASVLNEATAIASKQFKSNSTNAAGDSFNQVLAKQIEAKKNHAVEKTNSSSNDKAAVNKVAGKPETTTETSDGAASIDKEDQSDETQDDIANPLALFTLVENLTQTKALNGTDNTTDNIDKITETSSDLAVDAFSVTKSVEDDSKVTDVSPKIDGEIVDPSSTALDFQAQLASAVSSTQLSNARSDNLNETNHVDQSLTDKVTNLVADDSKKSVSKDADTKKTAELQAQSDITAQTTDIKESSQSKAEGNTFQEKLAAQQVAAATSSKDAIPANTDDQTASAPLNLTQASAHTHTVLPQAVEHVAPPVGTRAWDQALGQRVIWLVAGGQQTAELTLNPPELGPVQVVLNVNNDQLSAQFSSHQQEVRDALESSLPKLRQILGDAGIQLSGFSVNAGTQNFGQQFQQDRSGGETRLAGASSRSESASITSASPAPRVVVKEGLVDTFV